MLVNPVEADKEESVFEFIQAHPFKIHNRNSSGEQSDLENE